MTKSLTKIPLSQSSPTPLWQQMANSLRQRIESGELRADDQLPSEPELGEIYGVSRITVRKAVEVLLQAEFVVRARGRGTYVAKRALRHELSGLSGILDAIQNAADERPVNELVTCAFVPPPADAATIFGADQPHVMHLRRKYEVAGEPFGVADVFIPSAVELPAAKLDQVSAYGILEEQFGVSIARADVTIKACKADKEIARLLKLPASTTLLRFRRTSFCAEDKPRECTVFWVRPDRYEFTLSVNGPMPISEALRTAA